MFNRSMVQKALNRTREMEYRPGLAPGSKADGLDSLISVLIHDIFGGEILKTHKEKGWHFYNRIEGERIYFTDSGMIKSVNKNEVEDIPATPAETSDYFDKADYSNFFIRFIKVFEEAVGLKKYRGSITA